MYRSAVMMPLHATMHTTGTALRLHTTPSSALPAHYFRGTRKALPTKVRSLVPQRNLLRTNSPCLLHPAWHLQANRCSIPPKQSHATTPARRAPDTDSGKAKEHSRHFETRPDSSTPFATTLLRTRPGCVSPAKIPANAAPPHSRILPPKSGYTSFGHIPTCPFGMGHLAPGICSGTAKAPPCQD